MKHIHFLYISALISLLLFAACDARKAPEYTSEATLIGHAETRVLHHPEWARNATIYEVNLRQHTIAGTFSAFEKDLDRLDSMGIDIIWLMPINPIGVVNRKGSLGNCYSVKNYREVNPEFGNLDDFKRLVRSIHNKGMKVILGWVANHTSWDNPWIAEHPDWYNRDTSGIVSPLPEWGDMADLNFDNFDMRRSMTDAMKYWVKECDVDGFRCDAASMVPTDFWDETRVSLDSIKPVFMLSDAERKDHHLKAFDMSYALEFYHTIKDLATNGLRLDTIEKYIAGQDTAFPRSAYRLYFTTNYEENALNGTGNEVFGKARQVYDVLAFTIGGMPALYTGQEGGEAYSDGSPHRLKLFDKDTTWWNGYTLQNFYSRLLHAHKNNPALWNGENGGSFQRINTSSDDLIYAFARKKDNNEVIVLLNFSDRPQKIDFTEDLPAGDFRSIFGNQTLSIFTKGDVKLPAFGYQVFVK